MDLNDLATEQNKKFEKIQDRLDLISIFLVAIVFLPFVAIIFVIWFLITVNEVGIGILLLGSPILGMIWAIPIIIILLLIQSYYITKAKKFAKLEALKFSKIVRIISLIYIINYNNLHSS